MILLLALVFCQKLLAFTHSPEESLATMIAIVQKYQNKTICSNGATVKDAVNAVGEYSRAHPELHDELSNLDLYNSLVDAFPCPFNPKKVSVRQASSVDVVGFWGLASDSKQLSPKIYQRELYPAKCQFFGFYSDGDMRTMGIITQDECQPVRSSDFSSSRYLPGTISWKTTSNGVIEITRSDKHSSIEIWEVYVVTAPFEHAEFRFDKGDLLMYLAQLDEDKKKGVGTLYFRHLQRLSD
jgi:hypothetical protein